eukprot:gnl/Spiro4/4155_TR2077_c0_g1_i1.p1 gnl/Spiro4/4155_TR2077_c0_g1~~gnl/Spiro4/4155_TR2077_c0_g1_i1.p1  ORF type:complete len:294 (+),score=23.91 gnl/Spiro4/4155_TR2077_c0_g1_i1:139-1020(+)
MARRVDSSKRPASSPSAAARTSSFGSERGHYSDSDDSPEEDWSFSSFSDESGESGDDYDYDSDSFSESDSDDEICHVFIDHSNIFYGAARANGRRNPRDISLSIPEIVRVLEDGRKCKHRVVGGTDRGASVWRQYQRMGYDTCVGDRNTSGREDFVDDMLHAQIQRALCDALLDSRTRDNKRRSTNTLVMATGDGNSNSGRTNFVECAEMALEAGWDVEVWSWRRSLSRAYLSLYDYYRSRARHRHDAPRLRIFHLDDNPRVCRVATTGRKSPARNRPRRRNNNSHNNARKIS